MLNGNEISQKIQALINQYENVPLNTPSMQEQAFHVYRARLLKTLKEAFSSNPTKEALRGILAKNWDLVKKSCFSYTCLPKEELTILLINIAFFVDKEKALNVLMPGIKTESMGELASYPHLEPKDTKALQTILCTHILHDSTEYLIPVQVLADLPISYPLENAYNYYYDTNDENTNNAYLCAEEQERLFSHSTKTEVLSKLMLEYEALKQAGADFLARYDRLIQNLSFSSTRGAGKEYDAEASAYNAISDFFEYYEKLSKTQKNKIPLQVQEALTKLYDVASDPKKSGDTVTCLAIISERLKYAKENREIALHNVEYDRNEAVSKLAALEAKFSEEKTSLIKQIESNKYIGSEKKALLPYALCTEFSIIFPHQCSEADFKTFMAFEPENMKALLTQSYIVKQIANKIETDDGFKQFMACDLNRMETLLNQPSIVDKVAKKIGVSTAFEAFTHSSSLKKVDLVLSKVAKKLLAEVKINQRGNPFVSLLLNQNYQNNEIFKTVLKALVNLKEPIQLCAAVSSLNFNDDAAVRGDMVVQAVCEQRQLLTAVQIGDDLHAILKSCNTPKQRRLILESLASELPMIVGSIGELKDLLDLMPRCNSTPENTALRLHLINALKPTFPASRIGIQVYNRYYYNSSMEERQALMEAQPAPFSVRYHHWRTRLKRTLASHSSQRKAFLLSMKSKIREVPKRFKRLFFTSFKRIASYLDQLIPHMSKFVNRRINTAEKLNTVFSKLTLDERARLLRLLDDNKVVDLIDTHEKLEATLKYLPSEAAAPIFSKLSRNLSSIIPKDESAFEKMMNNLDRQQGEYLLNHLVRSY